MSREIQIVSTTTGTHHIDFGFDNASLATFSIQLYIEKTGKRAVDWLANLSMGYCSFMGGNIYLHNNDTVDRCTYFGEKKDAKLGVVFNEKGNLKKVLDSLEIGTDSDDWEVESITIPADQNYPHGQYSKIPSTKFVKREGGLYSEFLRNAKTTSSTAKAIEYLTGEPLRGSTAYLILKNTSADAVQLWEVRINATSSR